MGFGRPTETFNGSNRIPGFAKTPELPFYAVIFTAQRTERDDGYAAMAQAMFERALQQPGCFGAENVRGSDDLGIIGAYFSNESSIRNWKETTRHLKAQCLRRERWYRNRFRPATLF